MTAEEVLRELRKEKSGPGKAFATYLELPSDQRLECLVKAILRTREIAPADWQSYRPVVLEAAARIEEGGA